MWVEEKEREAHTCVFQFPFSSAGAPGPYTYFLLQEGEQVLSGPLLPHHRALQVRGEGLWDG